MKKEIIIKGIKIDINNINYVDLKFDAVYFHNLGNKDYSIKLTKQEKNLLENQLKSFRELVNIGNKFLNLSNIVSAEMMYGEKPTLSIKFKNQSLKILKAKSNDFYDLTKALEAQDSFMC